MMSGNSSFWRVALAIGAVLSCCVAAAQNSVAPVIVENRAIAQITHTTIVSLASPVTTLRVFHARPTPPQWWRRGAYVHDAQVLPVGAEIVPATDGVGEWYRWQLSDTGVGRLQFVTQFSIEIGDRRMDRKRVRLTFKSLDREAKRRGLDVDNREVPAELMVIAAKARADHDPVEAIVAFCEWTRDHISYAVEGVDYGTDDVAAIVEHKRGWCGHQSTVFQALCRAAGVPVRRVAGFHLKNADGLWNGRGDWNRHTWAEVFLGRAGWVEVEPTIGKDPFAIPRTFVRNPPTLQSHAVWVQVSDEWRLHESQTNTVAARFLRAR